MQVLHHIPKTSDPNVLVGLDKVDDAAVYKLTDDLAIVQSVDYFTPVVDDPYLFGRITGANALSDLYAMGAEPLFALNLVGFPLNDLPAEMLGEILKGGSDMAAEAGISIVGGHSIDDAEPKYGMSVTGKVHPDKIISNAGAREGDILILTKPIGTGVIATAIKKGVAPQSVIDEAVKWMTTLNRAGAEAMVEIGVLAATDVTGFGLFGHLHEMLLGSEVGAEIVASQVPVIEGTRELLATGIYPGGSKANFDFVDPFVEWGKDITEETKKILCDAQTSGGLIIAVAETKKEAIISALELRGVYNKVIGRIIAAPAGTIKVS